MKLPSFRKKYVAGALAAGLVMGAAGIAAAYFGVTGSGTATAKTGQATNVTIKPVGAGYDSILSPSSPDPYSASQCLTCGYTLGEIGGKVTLTIPPGATYPQTFAQLTSVTVPLVNFTHTVSSETVTLHLTTGPNGSYTFTKTAPIAPGTSATQVVTTVTFTFATQGVFVNKTFVYGVSLSNGNAGVNVALSKAPVDVSVGESVTKQPWTKKSGTFKKTTLLAPWTTYIPAARFGTVGGKIGALFPGNPASPVEYAVTNPGVTGAHLTTVSVALGTLPGTCATHTTWFQVYGSPHTVDRTYPPGLTVVANPGITIAMLTQPVTQDACAGMEIPLNFSGGHA